MGGEGRLRVGLELNHHHAGRLVDDAGPGGGGTVRVALRALLVEKKDITSDVQEGLVGAIAEFKKSWKPAVKA